MTIIDLQIQSAKDAFRSGQFSGVTEDCKLAMITRPCVTYFEEDTVVRKPKCGFSVGFAGDPPDPDDGPTWPRR